MNKNLSKLLSFTTIASAAALFSQTASSATFTVNDAQEFSNALIEAFWNGRDTQDTIILGDVFTTQEHPSFDIQSSVVIRGRPGFRVSRLVRLDNSVSRPLLNVQYKNVTVENLLLLGSGQNTNTQVAAAAGQDRSNSALINIAALNIGNGPDNFRAVNNTFQNSAVGVASIGAIPKNLEIRGNNFNNVNRAVELLRDVERITDVTIRTDNQVLDGGRLNISNNVIRSNRLRLGISVDAGNDGFPYVAPSFPNPTSFTRVRFRDKPTVFRTNSVINNNVIEGANEFGIAVATVRNINIAGNRITTGEDNIQSSPEIENNFTAGINIEHNAYFVNVDFNTVTVGATGPFATGINVLPYQDHGAPLDFRNTSDRVTLRSNVIRGQGRNAIFAFGYSNLQIINNDVTGFFTDSPFGVNASLYNIPFGLSNSVASGNRGMVFNGFDGNGSRAPQSFDSNGNVF